MSLSAVKNVHVAKRGIAKTKHKRPAQTKYIGRRKANRINMIIINSTSCIFISFLNHKITFQLCWMNIIPGHYGRPDKKQSNLTL